MEQAAEAPGSGDAVTPKPADLSALRTNIILHLATAIEAAAQRLAQAASGQSVFNNDMHAKIAIALVNLWRDLLPVLGEAARTSAPQRHENPQRPTPPLIPTCPICNAGPGAHWPDACPKNPQRKYVAPSPLPGHV